MVVVVSNQLPMVSVVTAMYGFYQSRKAEVFSHLIKSIIA
jgi:hypothetical protein